jgi:hypothetical protein
MAYQGTFSGFHEPGPGAVGGFGDITQALYRGFQTGAQPAVTSADLLQKMMQSKMNAEQAKYYGPKAEAEIAHSRAASALLGQQLADARRKAEILKENPFYGASGDLGKIGALMYMQQHPDIFGNANPAPTANETPYQSQIPSEESGQSYIPSITQPSSQTHPSQQGMSYQDMIKQSILKGLMPKEDILQGPAREAKDLELLRQKYGEDSQTYKNAKASWDARIQGQTRRGEGLRPGENYILSPEGSQIGISRPYTPAERQLEEGANFFSEVYPRITEGLKGFEGQKSIRRLEKMALNYGKDPVATKAIDDFLLSMKLATAGTISEAATLKGGKTNQVFNRIRATLDSTDIPKDILSFVKQYQLPPSAAYKANLRFGDIISHARDVAAAKVPARKSEYFNPQVNEQKQSTISQQPIKLVRDKSGNLVKAE